MELLPTQKRTWAEIDLDRIIENFRNIKQRAGSAKICCTIKANGYGHGAVTLGRVYQDEGADFFAVSNVEEALQLRNAGLNLPILILGYTDPECVELLSRHNISQCVYSYEYAKRLSNCAVKYGVQVKIHLKLDTGMGRIGFRCDEKDQILEATKLEGFIKEGIFTHFASADEGQDGREYTENQIEKFSSVIDYLKSNGVEFLIRHCSNSAGISDYKYARFDMVRAGIVLYGVQPSNQVVDKIDLKPALSLKSVISHVKVLNPGESVSYGRTFTADKKMVVATLPIGYADGLWRINSKKGLMVEVNGCPAPIIGRICMDQCIIDVTDIDAKPGDVVSVYGDNDYNSVDMVAKLNDTINYEVLCAVGARVPRIYLKGGEMVSYEDSICMKGERI